MSVALTANYIAQLNQVGQNEPVTIIEIELDSGTLQFCMTPVFSNVLTCIGTVSSSQNKLDTLKGYATRGSISFDILGRDNFKTYIKDEYLKNRRVNRYDGFVGLVFADYVKTFTGTIQSWNRKGDKTSFKVDDDVQKVTQKLPVAVDGGIQSLNYMNTNPVDIMLSILKTDLGIDASLVDTATFESERDTWRNGWLFHRVLNKPEEANKILNELQETTFSYIFHDGQKISFKAEEPPVPSTVITQFTDDFNIKSGTLNAESGYKDSFFNRVEVYYDYDESGSDSTSNYQTSNIIVDADSITNWGETKTRTIKSKYLRTFQWGQPTNVTGITIYHSSKDNGTGSGTLTYTFATKSLQWTAPSGTIGASVVLDADGTKQIFDTNTNKYIRVIVDFSALAGSNQSDTISLTTGSGSTYATVLANKILSKYGDPATSVNFQVSINNLNNGGNLLKVTDTIKLTTDEASDFGRDSWTEEQMQITSVRPDFKNNVVQISAIQKKSGFAAGLKGGFIAPAGQADYPTATEAEIAYAYIGDVANNQVNVGTVAGYYII